MIVDNFKFGGFITPISLETGRLDHYGRHGKGAVLERHERHPETGVIFGDIVIPHWAELKEAVINGAMILSPLVTVGWDVGVTEDGPVLVEANQLWNSDMPQRAGQLLGGSPIGQILRCGATARK